MLLIDQTQKAYSVIPIICRSRRSKTLVTESRTVIPRGGDWLQKGTKELFEVIEMFNIMIVMVVK